MLRADVARAWQLKRLTDAMALISERAMMVVSPDRFLLAVCNEDHHLPASLSLTPDWFLRYELTSPDDLGPHHYYVINLDLSTLKAHLLAANDTDRVTFRASNPWNTLRLTFVRGDTRSYDMHISLAQNPNLEPWFSMDIAEHRFNIGVNSEHLTRILEYSIEKQKMIRIKVNRFFIKLRSGKLKIFIRKNKGCWIGDIPRETSCNAYLFLHRAEYLLTFCQMAPTVDLRFGRYPGSNINPTPLMLIPLHIGGLLKISMPSNSVVRTRLQCKN